MKPKARFIKSVTQAAKECDTVLPWTRGARRKAFMAARIRQTEARKSA